MEYKDIKHLIDPIEGWMGSERQQEFMFELGKKTICAAEIGSYKGLSAAIVSLGMSENINANPEYYCIDTFESSNAELDGKSTYSEFENNLLPLGQSHDIRVLDINEGGCYHVGIWAVKGYSYNVLNKIPNNLDWIYIDGSHETPDVLQDIELYHPKVKDDGLLLFHDHTWPSVRKAVDIAACKGLIEVVEIFDDFGVYKKVTI